MKKVKIILSLLFLASGIALSQTPDWNWTNYHYRHPYHGYVIKADGEKIEGFLILYNQTENQESCTFLADTNDSRSKVIYKPADLKEYEVADKIYRSINYSGGLSAKPLKFLLLTKPGYISQYNWYDYDDETRKLEEKQVYQKGNEKPFENADFALRFAKFFSALTADYPEMSAKIANKEKGYGMLKILEIIDEYNAWYEQNHKQ